MGNLIKINNFHNLVRKSTITTQIHLYIFKKDFDYILKSSIHTYICTLYIYIYFNCKHKCLILRRALMLLILIWEAVVNVIPSPHSMKPSTTLENKIENLMWKTKMCVVVCGYSCTWCI